MKKITKTGFAWLILQAIFCSTFAQKYATLSEEDDKYIESDVVLMAGKKGFSFQTRNDAFIFKPYALVQAMAKINYYDDEQLDISAQDHYANSGFAIQNAIIGFSGKAFRKITFNFALNASQSGGALLQQAWFDVNMKETWRLRVGKFKTPYNQAYLVTLGETLFPVLPFSLTTGINISKSLNAYKPTIATGFDLGIQLHGLFKQKWEYRIGIFNGTGIGTNEATKGQSDDWKIPSLLYAGRLAFMPQGIMPVHQGSPDDLNNDKMLFALSGSLNVDAEDRSSNDYRGGIEFARLKKRLYLSAEAYLIRMNFTKRMQDESKGFTSWGGYIQAGYFITDKLQGAFRYDFFDRNGIKTAGMLNMPAIGCNYFFAHSNLKLQLMYHYIGRHGHATQNDRDMDDNGMAQHSGVAMLQYAF